ncbi:hypothetical protein [Mesorhizobium sp. CAU 1741]|uniref:hypothetical protein n=1 Tax=Mesorhizobium sp. CAU 1741 TaxID=3140366 RepID=UPI00325BCDAB
MALTNAEKQARWRQRQRAKAAGLQPEKELSPEPLTIPTPLALADFVKSREPELLEVFESFQDEGLPVAQFLTCEQKGDEVQWTRNAIRSLSEALETITGTLSEYQIEMIDQEIARLSAESKADPAKLDANLDTILRFKVLRRELERRHRLNLRNYH